MQASSKWSLLLVRIAAMLLLAMVAAHAEPVSVSDIVVKDGDTIHARGSDFRMIGYDTPETWTRRRRVRPDEQALAVARLVRDTD